MSDPRTTMQARLVDGIGMQQRRVDVGGTSTSVLEGGQGPPMVLLHGGIQCGGAIWWRALPRLAERHRVVVPDIPGLGASEPAGGPLDGSSVGVWLEQVIEMTCEDRPTLVAHSAPGALAARFAAERGEHLRRLVLVDAAGLGRFRPSPRLLAALVRSSVRPTRRSFEHLMGSVMHDFERVVRDAGEQWEGLATYVGSLAGQPEVKRAMRQIVGAGTKPIPGPDLRKLAVSTVLVWGRHDRLIPLAIAEEASKTLGWPVHVLDRSGHLPHVEQPDRFADVLLAATARQ